MAKTSVSRRKAKTPPPADAARLRTFTISSYPPARKLWVIKVVHEHSGLGLNEVRDRLDVQAAITFPTLEACNAAVEALGPLGVDFIGSGEPPRAGDTAHEVWSDLDDCANKMRAAKAVLAVIKIALLSPEQTPDKDVTVETLNVLQELLYQIDDGIDRSRETVHTMEQAAEVQS